MEKILVTGAAGFIGRNVVKALSKRGLRVIGFDVRPPTPDVASSALWIQANICDPIAVAMAMEGCSQVVHLAALVSVPYSVKQPQQTFERNIAGFQNVLEAARQHGLPGRLLYASSAAVYGTVQREQLLETDADAAQLLSPYAMSKLVNEKQAAVYNQCYGIRAVGLRFFNAYGEGQDPSNPYAGVLSLAVDALANGHPFKVYGDGLQTRDYIRVEDVAKAVAALLARPIEETEGSILNVASGRSTSLLDLLEMLEKLSRRKFSDRLCHHGKGISGIRVQTSPRSAGCCRLGGR